MTNKKRDKKGDKRKQKTRLETKGDIRATRGAQ